MPIEDCFKPKPPGYKPPSPTVPAPRKLEKRIVSVVLVSDDERLGYIDDLRQFIDTQLCGQLKVEEINMVEEKADYDSSKEWCDRYRPLLITLVIAAIVVPPLLVLLLK